MPDRRRFLEAAARLGFCACGFSALAPLRAPKRPRVSQRKRQLTIDIHAHSYVHEVWPLIHDRQDRPEVQGLSSIIGSPLFQELTSVEDRVAEMDREGIDVQAVSLHVGQYHYWAERELAAEIVRVQNEKLAEACARYPGRFVGIGAVALQFPDLAAEQMAHAVRSHGFRGFMITGSVNGEEISAPRFDPFWKKAEELQTVIFLHPDGFRAGVDRFGGNGWLVNTIGNPLETTTALSHMIFDGFLDRFPKLILVAAHGGGYLPTYIGRSDNCHSVDTRCRGMKKKPSEYLKQLYFDTLVYSPRVLRHLIDEVGAESVVLGTDYPFAVRSPDPLGDVGAVAGLGDAEKAAIFGDTAARLLKIS